MSEPYLTMAEISAKYPNEWVLIDRPKTTKYQEVLGGYVAAHGPNREDLDAPLEALPKPFHVAVEYTGPLIDDDMEAVL